LKGFPQVAGAASGSKQPSNGGGSNTPLDPYTIDPSPACQSLKINPLWGIRVRRSERKNLDRMGRGLYTPYFFETSYFREVYIMG